MCKCLNLPYFFSVYNFYIILINFIDLNVQLVYNFFVFRNFDFLCNKIKKFSGTKKAL